MRDDQGTGAKSTLTRAEEEDWGSLYQAWCTFLRGFIAGYAFRTGIAIGFRMIHLLRTKPRLLLSLTQLVGESPAPRVDAVRLGLTVGCALPPHFPHFPHFPSFFPRFPLGFLDIGCIPVTLRS